MRAVAFRFPEEGLHQRGKHQIMRNSMLLGRFSIVGSTVIASALFFAGTAQAQSANLEISAEVVEGCAITTDPMDFSYDPQSLTAATASGAVNVTCTIGVAASIALDEGENAIAGSPAVPARRAFDGVASFLNYELFQPGGLVTVWGAGGAPEQVEHTGDGTETALVVNGRMAAGQNVTSGTYVDTVIATVSF
jgi:spore coat protein U-like protein